MGTPSKSITVLAGGNTERYVSCLSGRNIVKSLERQRFCVHYIDYQSNKDLLGIPKKNLVFIALHGGDGEGGYVQKILDRYQLKYTGSCASTSALCLSKILTKQTLINAGLQAHILPYTSHLNNFEFFFKKYGYAFLKPDLGGSSIDIYCIFSIKDFPCNYLTFKGNWMLEVGVMHGQDISIPVLHGHAIGSILIKSSRQFFDFTAKYHDPQTKYISPAPYSKKILSLLSSLAEEAYKACGCKSLARIDFIMDKSYPYILEINTIPGMADHSLAWKAIQSHMSYDALVLSMLQDIAG